jgi:DNA mismatch repair protein MutS
VNALQSYLTIKAGDPDSILAFRVGDFYEFFHEDAKLVSRVIGLTLTTRNKSSEPPIPMAGFPYHQLDRYLQKLVASGHRVAVCEPGQSGDQK